MKGVYKCPCIEEINCEGDTTLDIIINKILPKASLDKDAREIANRQNKETIT